MQRKILAALLLGCMPLGSALAESMVREILSSGATTASTYMTSKDDKRILAIQEDAGTFVASNGEIRGPYLEAALRQVRDGQPQLQASDMELATAILAAEH